MVRLEEEFVEGVKRILIDEYRERYHSEPSKEVIAKRLDEIINALNLAERK